MASLQPDIIENKYRIIRTITEAGHGKIYEIEVIDDFSTDKYQFKKGMKLAMKEGKTEQSLNEVGEIDILNRVNHPNVVSAYDTFLYTGDDHCKGYRFVMPLATYSLYQLLLEQKKISLHDRLNPDQILDLMFQLLCGLNYLHDNRIVHEDIKLENILIYTDTDGTYIPKFTDFGLSMYLATDRGINGISHPLGYQSIEMLEHQVKKLPLKPHLFEADIWALGVIFLEMIHGRHPFPERDPSGILSMINRFFITDTSPYQLVLKDAKQLVYKMLSKDPAKRISAREALKDPVFSKKNCSESIIEYSYTPIHVNISDIDRSSVLRWMNGVRVAEKKDYFYLFLAIDIFDRYMAIAEYTTDSIKIIALTTLFISSELTYRNREISKYASSIKLLGANTSDFLNLLCKIIKTLNWNLFRPTIYLNNPHLDPNKIFECYLENVNISLEKCQI